MKSKLLWTNMKMKLFLSTLIISVFLVQAKPLLNSIRYGSTQSRLLLSHLMYRRVKGLLIRCDGTRIIECGCLDRIFNHTTDALAIEMNEFMINPKIWDPTTKVTCGAIILNAQQPQFITQQDVIWYTYKRNMHMPNITNDKFLN